MLTRIARFLQNRSPSLFYRFINPFFYRNQYKLERLAANGKLRPTSLQPSILFYTAHKCASVLAQKVLMRLSEKNNMVYLNLDDYILRCRPTEFSLYESDQFYKKAFPTTGIVFGPFRGINRSIELPGRRKIINLRDPRDVLVSDFYSRKYSHEMNLTMIGYREKAASLEIDPYVIANIGKVRDVYAAYSDYIENNREQALILSYEEMVTDFASWVKKLQSWCGLPPVIKRIEDVSRDENFRGRNIKTAHKRRVTPGEHRSVLKPETIDILNRELRDTLLSLNYAI